jgi:hypothetical protein
MIETSLWGNLALDDVVETPVSILKTQAALLSRMTKNVFPIRPVAATPNSTLRHSSFISH